MASIDRAKHFQAKTITRKQIMKTDTQQRCAIMVRGSRQEKDRQIQDLREAIAANGWQEVELIEEGDIPGEAMTRAIELVSSKAIDKLVIHNNSRIARRSSIAHELIEILTNHGVSLYWRAQDLETLMPDGKRNPAGNMILTMAIASEHAYNHAEDMHHWCDNVKITVQKVKRIISKKTP